MGCLAFVSSLKLKLVSSLLSPIPHKMAAETVNPAPAPQCDAPDHFILPDLVSHCTFPLVYHRKGDAVAKESVRWLDANCPVLNNKRRRALYGLQAGELTAFCYNTAEKKRLRVVSDFMNYLFHL